MKRDPLPAKVLATRLIPNVSADLAKQLNLRPDQKSLALITADCDDVTYTALDEATKKADCEVVYAKSFYGGAANANTALAGEIIGILAASILVKVYMFYYNHALGKKLQSAAMNATAMDSLSDTISTALVLAATVISQYTGLLLDGWFGLLVGFFILYAGISAMKDTLNPLLGQKPDPELVHEIEDMVNSSPVVHGIHDLIIHDYGPGRRIISLHAEVSAEGDLLEIHDEIDNVEHALQEMLNCSATIHMDPIITNDEEVVHMREEIQQLVSSADESFKMHDFRMVKGSTHTNLIFDVVVPYQCRYTDSEVSNLLREKVRQIPHGNYFAVIQVDHDFC